METPKYKGCGPLEAEKNRGEKLLKMAAADLKEAEGRKKGHGSGSGKSTKPESRLSGGFPAGGRKRYLPRAIFHTWITRVGQKARPRI